MMLIIVAVLAVVIIAMVTKRGRKPTFKRAEPPTGYCVNYESPLSPGKAFCGTYVAYIEEKFARA